MSRCYLAPGAILTFVHMVWESMWVPYPVGGAKDMGGVRYQSCGILLIADTNMPLGWTVFLEWPSPQGHIPVSPGH